MKHTNLIAAIAFSALSFTMISSAGAEEKPFFVDDTVACINATQKLHIQKGCIGTSANLCMDTSDGGSTTHGMSRCLDGELKHWDNVLNIVYKALKAKAVKRDAANVQAGIKSAKLANSLRKMQRAWIVWRDATCNFESDLWSGGTGAGVATYQCLMRLTGEQALALRASEIAR